MAEAVEEVQPDQGASLAEDGAAADMANAEEASAPPAPAASDTSDGLSEARSAAITRLTDLVSGVTDLEVLSHLAKLRDGADLVALVNKALKPATNGFRAPAAAPLNKAQASQVDATAKSSNLGVVDSKSLAVGGAGAGGGLGLNAPGFGPKVQHFAGGGARGSVTKVMDIDEDLRKAWLEMIDSTNTVTWVMGTYTADWKQLKLEAKGEGGLRGFKESLGDGLGWGGFACSAVDKRGGLECKRAKFIFVQYKPEAVSAIKKAKQGPHKGVVKEAFPGAHLDIVVESLADLNEQGLIEKLQAATGAHKPNGYEFEEGVFMEADYYGLGIGKECKGESAKN
mmetsp:Transcript_42870/g.100575  ORF Transcript_42870/g.100575 Transcript_42870/m.100575 type:complete len:340 (+) Transcript_42870:122-1141(+)|eukprot:CAMPEP_0178446852 /NCGR_PEP_ID=MMETSP0689_2-20121128/41052_1 /TAXON_ID=160604 /ORGANISM="Amphidinium massartii, Strain CS-259" /LENGTH=339 /DNA_ID=CAMNT_0020071759 /DNA_START=33 /DNA_END=1052 /DNA_ORIENTATION=+